MEICGGNAIAETGGVLRENEADNFQPTRTPAIGENDHLVCNRQLGEESVDLIPIRRPRIGGFTSMYPINEDERGKVK